MSPTAAKFTPTALFSCLLLGSVACTGPTQPTARTTEAAHEHPRPSEPQRHRVQHEVLTVETRQFELRLPQGRATPLPSVLVLHSAMGRTNSVLTWCDRLAAAGYAAVAFDFYEGKTASSPEQAIELRDWANTRAQATKATIERTWDALRNDPRIVASHRFLLGWSFGAAWATHASGFLPEVSGVVALYGEGFSDDPALFDRSHAPILFVGARRDGNPTPDTLRQVVDALSSRGKQTELALFDAGHGFAERTHPGYDPAAAEQSWRTVLEVLGDWSSHPR